jgi:hypothetical protein
MTDLPPWTLPQFEEYVDIALESMAKQGAVRADANGQPICKRRPAGQTEDGTLWVAITADLSASGLPSEVPITASTHGSGPVVWSLGNVPIATIPSEWMPEEAGEAIGQNRLRAAYQRWARSGRVGERAR